MVSESKYRTLIWLVIILIAINLSTVGSLLFHTRNSEKKEAPEKIIQSETILNNGVRHFREKLDLEPDQVLKFREINREFNRSAGQITKRLEFLRVQMIEELARPESSSEKIGEINREFGDLHEQLKNLTAGYYLQMKAACNSEQQLKLYEIFIGMVQKDEPTPPGHGRRRGRAWRDGSGQPD
jgi:hypothetical protein